MERVKATLTYASFRLTCKCTDPDVFLDVNIWPEGSLVRWWREQRTAPTFSRDAATSAGTNAAIVATVDNDDTVIVYMEALRRVTYVNVCIISML